MQFSYVDICHAERAPSSPGSGSQPLMTLGEQLRAVRLAAGLKQEDLVLAGVAGQSTVSELENGRRASTTDVLERWAIACGAHLAIRRKDANDPLVEATLGLSSADLARLTRIARALPRLKSRTAEVLTASFEGAAEDASE